MLLPSRQQFERWKKNYSYVPVMKKISVSDLDVAKIFEKIRSGNVHSTLLESGPTGRYSYIGLRPFLKITAKDGHTLVQDLTNDSCEERKGNPLFTLKEFILKYRSPKIEGGPDWQGGAAGYLSYDMARYFEKLPCTARDDLDLPDLYVLFYADLLAIDRHEGEMFLISGCFCGAGENYDDAEKRLEQWSQRIANVMQMDRENEQPQHKATELQSAFSHEGFISAVEKAKEYIAAGDVFQVNLSVRRHAPLTVDPWSVYRELRILNPSPYMAYLDYPELQLVSGSPELLVKVKGKEVSTRPIAGTRRRGTNREEDLRLAAELTANEKERAEHIMLVDLERNDLGRVCRYGSVRVDELMVVEEYSHVMHIVSHVSGELQEDCDAFSVIEATFPGGTITGAPKVRTMEIIEELEPVRRGPYTGSIGWLGFDGDMELNIIIRTMVVKEGIAHVQAGAGIVADSVPEKEYEECLRKAEALWQAVRISEAKFSRV